MPTVRGLNRWLGGGGYWLECYFDTTGSSSTNQYARLEIQWAVRVGAWRTALELDWSNRRVVVTSGTTDTLPGDNPNVTWNPDQMKTEAPGRWHVGFWVTVNDTTGATTVEFRLTGPSGTTVVGLPSVIPQIELPAGSIKDVAVVLGDLAVEALQFTPTPGIPPTPTQDGTWKRGAVLDAPAYPLTVVPTASGSAWDMITTIAKATLSTAEFDQDGVFRWRTGARWATAPTIADLTVSSTRELASLTATEEIDACRNWVRARWQRWNRVKSTTTYTESAATLTLPPGKTIATSWVTAEDQLDALPPIATNGEEKGGIRFTMEPADNAVSLFGAVEIGLTREDGLTTLTLRNRRNFTLFCRPIVSGTGFSWSIPTPALPTETGPEDVWVNAQNTESQRYYGRQVYDHDTSGWVQDNASALDLAQKLLNAGRLPIPLLADIEVLPDPRIRLGDVVRVVDLTGGQLDTLAWVVGNRITGSEGAVKQVLALRGTASPGYPADAGLTPDPPAV